MRQSSTPLLTPLGQEAPTAFGRFMVLIYNDDHTSFEDVIRVLMEATGCTPEEAYTETWEAHHYGQAPVHFAGEAACQAVAAIIGRIGVKTAVMKEWND